MQIFIRTLDGKDITLGVYEDDTVQRVHDILAGLIHLPVGEQRLVFNGKVMVPSEKLSEYGIKDDSKLYLLLRLK